MSENTPENSTTVKVEADQAVVNNAPDGGGVDNQAPTDQGSPATSKDTDVNQTEPGEQK